MERHIEGCDFHGMDGQHGVPSPEEGFCKDCHTHSWIWRDDSGPVQVCTCGATRDVSKDLPPLMVSAALYDKLARFAPPRNTHKAPR